jgi:molybdopterin/thiamine biosynthesis adenylyltransferase
VPSNAIDLGRVDLISAGAISHATLYALMRLPKVQMSGRIFDDDLTGESNLNRNMLTLASDVGSSKVQVVAERCGTKLRLEPVASRFAGNSFSGNLAPRVLVGVDDIPSRWEVQLTAAGWAAVSGTSHFNVSSSAHYPDEPCSGCLHPVDDSAGANPIPTVSFVSFWAGLSMAVRLLREALAIPYPRNRQHLWLTPLRMDRPHAAMWLPVAARRDCPVHCWPHEGCR